MPEVLRKTTSVLEDTKQLKEGTHLWKIRKVRFLGFRSFRREFKVDEDALKITYLPTKKSAEPTIYIKDIVDVKEGHSTDIFNKLVRQCRNSDRPRIRSVLCPAEICFSLIFIDPAKMPPLNLVADTATHKNVWLNALKRQRQRLQLIDERGEFKLQLRQMFQEADKNDDSQLTLDEIQEFIDSKLQVKITTSS